MHLIKNNLKVLFLRTDLYSPSLNPLPPMTVVFLLDPPPPPPPKRRSPIEVFGLQIGHVIYVPFHVIIQSFKIISINDKLCPEMFF